MSDVIPDIDQSIDFLNWAIPNEDWTLTSIHPETNAIETRTLNPPQARKWLEKKNGVENIYWHINPLMSKLNKKAEKKDVREVRFFHVDIDFQTADLAEERSRILNLLTDRRPKGVPPCTAIVFSGGGAQAYWRLITPIYIGGDIKKAEDAERYNRQLEALLGADACFDVCRIMRLPGTINIPNKKKIARGRIPALAQVIDLSGPDYDVKAFRKAEEKPAPGSIDPKVTDQIKRLDDLSELDQYNIPNAVKIVIAQGKGEQDREGGDNSRSGWLLWAIMSLVSHNVPEEIILGIITDPGWGISESVLEKKNVLKYAQRQIGRAKARAKTTDDFARDHKSQKPLKTQGNIKLALTKLEVELSHDKFSDRLLIQGLDGYGPYLQDESLNRLWLLMEEQFDFLPTKDYFQSVVEDIARQNAFHPVLDYLGDLTWDGIPRIDTWLTRYGSAVDTPYTRAVGALVLLAAVRRVRQPGVKFDEMLILQGSQGGQKSTALSDLVPDKNWFSDDLPLSAESKVVIEQVTGRWIVEAADLKGSRKADLDHIKAMLSRCTDRARLAYGRIVKDQPRQFIVIGTTNDSKFLKDLTGNRRFWPVKVGNFKLAALREDRDQLWAEAAFREAQGESIRLNPALYEAAAEEQEDRKIEDPYVEILSALLGDLEGRINALDVWKLLNIPEGQRDQTHSGRVNHAMQDLGWEKVRSRTGSRREYTFVKGDSKDYLVLIQNGDQWIVDRGDPGVF